MAATGRRAVAPAARRRLRARRRGLPGRHRPRALDRRRPVQRVLARDLGGAHQPQRHAPRARDGARVVDAPAVRARDGGRGDRLEPARRDRALVRAGPRAARRRRTPTRRRRPTGSCSTIPGAAEELGARARERALDEHTYVASRAAPARAARARRPRRASAETPAARRPRLAALRRVAIVPAFNEEERDRARDRRAPRLRPGLRRRRRRRRLDRPDGRRGRARAGAQVVRAAVQPRHRRRRADRLPLRVRARLRRRGPGRRRRPARPVASSARSSRPVLAGEADVAVGSRFAGGDGYRSSRVAPRRASACSRGSSRADRRQRVTDPTSGFQALNRLGDRAVRRRLPARLPRGRGDGDGAQAPAAPASRCRSQMREREAGRSSITRAPLGLLHGQGLLAIFVGLFRRNVDATGGARDPARRLDRRGDRVGAPAARRLRADPQPPAARALRAALAADRRRAARAVALARRAEHDRRLGRDRDAIRPRCCSRSARSSSCSCCCTTRP